MPDLRLETLRVGSLSNPKNSFFVETSLITDFKVELMDTEVQCSAISMQIYKDSGGVRVEVELLARIGAYEG